MQKEDTTTWHSMLVRYSPPGLCSSRGIYTCERKIGKVVLSILIVIFAMMVACCCWDGYMKKRRRRRGRVQRESSRTHPLSSPALLPINSIVRSMQRRRRIEVDDCGVEVRRRDETCFSYSRGRDIHLTNQCYREWVREKECVCCRRRVRYCVSRLRSALKVITTWLTEAWRPGVRWRTGKERTKSSEWRT